MEKTARMTAEDIAFWIIIAIIVGIAIWKLFGSSTDTATIISVTLAVASSELLLWRAFFSMDKKVACGFMKMSYEMKDMKKEVNEIKTDIREIKNIVKRRQHGRSKSFS